MGLEPNEKSKQTEHDQNAVVNTTSREEHEEALVALVEHRTREVKNGSIHKTSVTSSVVETKHVSREHDGS